ncbi:DegV family protein [Erysipelotrichaceae bacterium OttesenSCG-928-M19]|nr:DegV family protein [Erysipelotrichaceae bacterium OttesenSCG-928-M19]
MKIKLITDSTIVYNPKEAKEHNVALTPFIINDNGTIYRDNVDVAPKEFYELWKKNNYIKTSQPNLNDTIELFKKELEEYDHLIYFPIPEALSGTYATGQMAAKEVDASRITVINTHTGAGMGRVMVDVANKMIAEGKSVEEIVDKLMKASEYSRFFIMPLSLEGLRLGGRISNVAASVFSLIKMKICLYLTPIGAIDKFEVARTESKIIKLIVDKVKNDIGVDDLLIYLIYTDDESLLDSSRVILEKEFPNAQFELIGLSPTLGAHTGPSTIAFHFCKKHW